MADPGRLLQPHRVGPLLDRLRRSFDVVIIDTSPVLPVPDALCLGRCVDGAILATRFDASRYPLVERANRRLVEAGIPVLGLVVNGVKSFGSHYNVYGGVRLRPRRHASEVEPAPDRGRDDRRRAPAPT